MAWHLFSNCRASHDHNVVVKHFLGKNWKIKVIGFYLETFKDISWISFIKNVFFLSLWKGFFQWMIFLNSRFSKNSSAFTKKESQIFIFSCLSKTIVDEKLIYKFKMHKFDVLGKIKKSNNVLCYISTEICKYFNNNLHQFIWRQCYFSTYYGTAKILQGGKSAFNES